MNKKELIIEITKRTKLRRDDVESVMNTFMDIVGEKLADDEKVQLMGFGTFDVRERAARKGNNPKTGEMFQIPAKKVPAFKAGNVLKSKLRS